MTNTLDIKKAGHLMDPAMEDAVYIPTAKQRELKAKFWEGWRDAPSATNEAITSAIVVQETGETKIHGWWKKPLFREWFLNGESFVHKTIANGERGVEIIQEIMDDPTAPPSIRLKAALAAVEALTKLRARTSEEKYADKELAGASSEELDRMIRRLENK